MKSSFRQSLLFLLPAFFFCIPALRAQQLQEGFRSRYASALVITPINTAFDLAPKPAIDLIFSLSAEYSVRSSPHIAYVLAGGYYPYFHRTEGILSFSLRTFAAQSDAPTGTFLDWSVIGGVENDRPTTDAPNPSTQPLYGIGVRVGGLRNSRFNWFAFDYGAGTSLVMIGHQPQLRAQLFFGLGFLLGREVLVN